MGFILFLQHYYAVDFFDPYGREPTPAARPT
jgi:hypothetical protein